MTALRSRARSSFRLVEAVEDAAVAEVLGLRVVPVLRDRRDVEALYVGELRGVLREDCRIGGAIVVLGDDVLPLRRVEEFEVGLRRRRRLLALDVLVDPRD